MSTTRYIVDNQSEQTINNESILRPYKVYTALLTQSGGDNLETFAWEYLDPVPEVPTLLDGVSYYIDSNDSNTDFTIAGAPNNNGGTSFVANGTQPDWQPPFEIEGNYIQIEYNTGAPVVTVLENTIGNIWFTYDSIGLYYAKSTSLFTVNKTIALFGGAHSDTDLAAVISCDNSGLTDSILPFAVFFDGSLNNSHLLNTPIEIRVYNSPPPNNTK